jgi:hypothetical protein
VIFKERELNRIGRGLLPYDAVLLDGVEPALKAAELEVVPDDDRLAVALLSVRCRCDRRCGGAARLR